MNCLITGASYGIGRELAFKMASLGYNLYLTYYTNKNLLEKVKEEIESKYNVKCLITKCDLKNEDDIKKLFHDVKNNFHSLDVLVNNASFSSDNLFLEKSKEEFLEVLEVNILGTFLMSKTMIPIMRKDATIINMASTDGIDTFSKYNVDYAVSKAGIIQLTKSMALIFDNIKTIAIAPNWVDTESTQEMDSNYLKSELNRLGQKKLISPIKVASVIAKVINDKNIKSGEVVKIYD